jgi:hypothetical protein
VTSICREREGWRGHSELGDTGDMAWRDCKHEGCCGKYRYGVVGVGNERVWTEGLGYIEAKGLSAGGS